MLIIDQCLSLVKTGNRGRVDGWYCGEVAFNQNTSVIICYQVTVGIFKWNPNEVEDSG